MPCDSNRDGLLTQLKDLVQQIDDGGKPPSCPCGPPVPSCAPCETPFAQVCFTCPPCVPLPTTPCPVKPLQMPCPKYQPSDQEIVAAEAEGFNNRYDNFYNGYNIGAHPQRSSGNYTRAYEDLKSRGCTVDGKSPHCDDCGMKNKSDGRQMSNPCCGCPTGFKPCKMKLQPPPCCNPIGAWNAQIQECSPK